MPDMTLGNAPQLVYVSNLGTLDSNEEITARQMDLLKRYDVQSGATKTIIELPATGTQDGIDDVQVSRDGKWILFTRLLQERKALQLVRIDGKFLQTLYCSQSSLRDVQWSPDQRHLVLVSSSDGETFSLLTLQSGQVDLLFQPTPKETGFAFDYQPLTWVDNSRLYLTSRQMGGEAPLADVYMLDTNKGMKQTEQTLQRVLDTTTDHLDCWDFASSDDATQLFVNRCEQKSGGLGTGRIDLLPPTGGTPRQVFTSSQLAITHVRTIGYGKASKLLFSVYNQGPGINFDQSNDGLYTVNTDGSDLKRLTSSPNSELNRFGQYPWSNVSRDGGFFSVSSDAIASRSAQAIYVGSLSGTGSLTKVAARGDTVVELFVAGWTSF